MELLIIFACICGTFFTVRCVDGLAERLKSKKQKKVSKTVRKAWYCFFSPERLLGEEKRRAVSETQNDRQDKTRTDMRRRAEEQRRRLVLKT